MGSGGSGWGRRGGAVLVALLLSVLCVGASVFDYSSFVQPLQDPYPLQDVDASIAGNTITYQVDDPVRGKRMDSRTYGDPPTDLRGVNGVVSWRSDRTMYYAAYNPQAGEWQLDSRVNRGLPTDIQNVGGVVSWRYDKTTYYTTYDPELGAWNLVTVEETD